MYKYLNHTADILIEAKDKTFEKTLEQAALAMFNVIGNAKPKQKFEIISTARNKEQLVVYFLSDLLTEMEIKEVVFSNVIINKLDHKNDKWILTATAMGDKTRPKDQVKAVTHHMIKVKETKNMCLIQVLLDV